MSIDLKKYTEKINRIIDALLAMQEQEDITISALLRQLTETEKGIENVLNAIQQGTQTITFKEVEDFLGSDLVGLSPLKNPLLPW